MQDLKIFAKTIDEKAKAQIYALLAQPAFANCKVRIMPDVHSGLGCVIGFTADLGEKVIPNIVGVDIGCGMLTVELGNIDINFEMLDSTIREFIPSGRNANNEIVREFNIEKLRCYKHLKETEWIRKSLGSLGGGNHFIEVDTDEDNNKYLVVHTGSRNLGKQVAEYYQNFAIDNLIGKSKKHKKIQNLINQYKAEGREKEIQSAIAEFEATNVKISKELCYLTGNDRLDYLHDMGICQDFAKENRQTIAKTICNKMGWIMGDGFETIHNYIESGTLIVRKGAISAKQGEKVLIPINMRDGCIIGVGKGNDDWNSSAPHGAGRIMSRVQAKETLKLEDYQHAMNGIFTTSVCNETIDESPQVYKPMQEIIACITDTVEIQKIIKPIYNFKAKE